MEAFSDRLRKILNIRNMRQSELSEKSGIGKSAISQYLSGSFRPKQDNIYKLSCVLDVSEAWLMGFDVPMERTPGYAKTDDYPAPEITNDYTTFPVIGEIAAGYDRVADEAWDGETVEIPNSYLQGRNKSDFFVLRVKGDSMYPLYHEGDKVLVLRQPTLNASGEIGAVIYDDDIGTLKKVEYVQGEDWLRLVPINPNIPPIMIEGERLEHCRVIGIPRLMIREIN